MPKSYIIAKWIVYSLVTLALFGLQHLILNNISVFGVTPFLYPMLPALVSSYEGPQRGIVFSLVLGAVCDMLLIGPFEGFYAITFVLIGIFAAKIADDLSSGWLCGFLVSLMALGLNAAAQLGIFFLSGDLRLFLMGRIALTEIVLSLPAIFLTLPLYRWVHRRCAVEY